MKVLLVEPPFMRLRRRKTTFFPIGLGYLAGVLAKHSFDVKIYNLVSAEDVSTLAKQQPLNGDFYYRSEAPNAKPICLPAGDYQIKVTVEDVPHEYVRTIRGNQSTDLHIRVSQP